MRWIDYRPFVLAILLVCLLSSAPSAEEKQLTIYALQLNYSVTVAQRNGADYVGLLDALEPLGDVSATADGPGWKLRFRNQDAEFRQGANFARVAGQKVGLPEPFLLENNRGLVPLRALPAILGLMLASKPDYHDSARRLFLEGAGIHFTEDIRDASLTVNFTAPVNPLISTEPGKLKMTFTHDPVLSNSYIQRLENPLVSTLTFSESNGRAELTVQGRVPLLAKFAPGGRSIEIVAAPAQGQLPPATASGEFAPAPVPPPPTLASLTAKPQFLVMLDPGHGGDDRGALLSDKLQEKDVTLAFGRRLRNELQSHGINAIMSRDADVTVANDQRATMADAARVAVYVGLHAGSLGRGVRVYTALLNSSSPNLSGFLPWDSAQSGYVLSSRGLADLVKAELGKHEISTSEMWAPVRPLNNVAAAAIAVEVAPSGPDVNSLAASVYQQRIALAIAEAITVGRARVEAQR